MFSGQLIRDYQEHAAVVSVETSPKVGYGYADGSAGHIRPTGLTYPNGRLLRREYCAGPDDAFNRPSFLADDDAGEPDWRLAEYAYLGPGQVIEMHHEEPDLLFTLAHGAGYDPYAGLDRFDRTVDMRWTCCMDGPSGPLPVCCSQVTCRHWPCTLCSTGKPYGALCLTNSHSARHKCICRAWMDVKTRSAPP